MFQRMAFHEETSDTVRQKISTFEISSFALKAIMQGQNWYESTEEYHASLILPVLLVYGKGDQFVTLGEEQWMQETIFGADLEVIEGAGHMVILEKPTHVNDAIHRFLNRDSSTWSSHPAPEERPPGRGAAFQSPQLLENSEASVRSNGGRLSRLSRTSIRSKTMM
ncbi:protein ABHD8-like [Clytia hemisphaerica]|uniref:acylglycerol lipase n=1 Tax=Clytia hemisphaerica TaxID=252671 RepID=A0A7M5UVX1_9CNID